MKWKLLKYTMRLSSRYDDGMGVHWRENTAGTTASFGEAMNMIDHIHTQEHGRRYNRILYRKKLICEWKANSQTVGSFVLSWHASQMYTSGKSKWACFTFPNILSGRYSRMFSASCSESLMHEKWNLRIVTNWLFLFDPEHYYLPVGTRFAPYHWGAIILPPAGTPDVSRLLNLRWRSSLFAGRSRALSTGRCLWFRGGGFWTGCRRCRGKFTAIATSDARGHTNDVGREELPCVIVRYWFVFFAFARCLRGYLKRGWLVSESGLRKKLDCHTVTSWHMTTNPSEIPDYLFLTLGSPASDSDKNE